MAHQTRAVETRAATSRPQIGGEIRGRLDIDVSALPNDLEPTWIREECLGEYQGDNVAAALERGYRPVTADELPQYKTRRLPGARGNADSDDTLIRRGGQVLMVRDRQIAEQERQAYAEMTDEATRSVARDTAAPKDGKNFRDLEPEVSVRVDRGKGRFSET